MTAFYCCKNICSVYIRSYILLFLGYVLSSGHNLNWGGPEDVATAESVHHAILGSSLIGLGSAQALVRHGFL